MVRTRFAPSPTGFLHVGGLRSALYNYLFARKHGGKFLLRIEDTDQKRAVAGAAENLIATLAWAGLEYDEGPKKNGPFAPYIQSERTDLYRKFAGQLLEAGHAYRCFCTAERLETMRASQQEHKQAPMYDRKCAGLSTQEIKKQMAAGISFVIRQKIPHGEKVSWTDMVRSDVSFESATIDDQVLLKSDRFPTYHLANVVDDHLMEITHVIRGEEWLSSTPKHILLYRALGWQPPSFAHLPLLLNKDRSKLSKRQGDVAAEEYKNKGFLPEALVNFVALLGWHPGENDTQEIFSLKELVDKFSFDHVHKAGAVFDLEKLNWMNWQWRRRKFEEEVQRETTGHDGDIEDIRGEKLIEMITPHIPQEWLTDKQFLKRCIKTAEEKILQNPHEAPQHLDFYFAKDMRTDPALMCSAKMKVDEDIAKKSLTAAHEALRKLEKFDDEEKLKTCLAGVVAELGVKNGQVFWPLRVALTNEQFSPGVFEVLWALGKEKSLERIQAALTRLE